MPQMEKIQPFISRVFKCKNKPSKAPSGDSKLSNLQQCFDTEHVAPFSANNSRSSRPDGLEILYNNPDATVDICFIHGLTGGRVSAWTTHRQSTPWLEALLPSKLSSARILTYGYNICVPPRLVAGSNRLTDHATKFLSDLTADRASCNASSRPLIFVAHSLGGLICKEAILLSRNNPDSHLRSIFNCTKGIIFVGTPHSGSWMAEWEKIPAVALGVMKATDKSLLGILETDVQSLLSVQNAFLLMIRELGVAGRRVELACFYEELPLPVVGKVVSQDSATLRGYSSFSIHANHNDMAKFGSAEDSGYKQVLHELMKWHSQIKDSTVNQSTESTRDLQDRKPVSSSVQWYSIEAQFDKPRDAWRKHAGISIPFSEANFSTPVHFDPSKPQPSLLARDCLQSLAFPNMYDRPNNTGTATTGTCAWLLQHEKYLSWSNSNRGLLWITGKAGSGKSTLLQYALNNVIMASERGNRDLVLSFFFHRSGFEFQKTPLGLFRSLIYQILNQAPDALQDLIATFQQRCDSIGKPSIKWDWQLNELQSFFVSSLSKILESHSVWLFVDALDECGEDSAVDIASTFKSILHRLPCTDLQIRTCFTCRYWPVMDQDCGFEICLEQENKPAISTYVQTQLSSLHFQSIPDLITTRASGVFIWAHHAVKRVLELEQRGVRLKRIEDIISAISTDLNSLYLDLVGSMDEESESLKLIQWICFARQPLSLDELRWAMIVDPECPYSSLEQCQNTAKYIRDNPKMEKRVNLLSRGLAEVVPFSNARVVQFIHQSVKDFFLETGLSALQSRAKSTQAASETAAGLAHYRLSRICIRYLAMEEIAATAIHDDARITTTFPLLNYATTFWVVHARHSETENHSQEDLLQYFSWPSEHLLQLWVSLYNVMEQHSCKCPPKGTSMVHIVSRYQLLGPLQMILHTADQSSTNIDAEDTSGRTPLSWAAANGHKIVVDQLLATHKINVKVRDNSGRTPLSWASGNGHVAVVQRLLDTGRVDMDMKDIDGRTPLSWAARNGHKAVVLKLLATGRVEVNVKDICNRTPLWWAAENGHVAIVEQLLGTGRVDVNAKDEYGRQLLSWAVENEHVTIVQQLLATGKVDINEKVKYGWTMLSWAARSGHELIVQQVLATGKVDIDATDNLGRTALSWATRNGCLAIVQQLLATGKVAVDRKDNLGQTPLLLAVENGHEAVVQQLLATGKVDIDATDNLGRTALSWAARSVHETIVEQLLATGEVDVDAKDEYGQTPLSLAAENGHEMVVQKLLASGQTDVNLKDDEFSRTPLLWAAENGYMAVVQQLLDTGRVDVNAKDKYGRRPLSWAEENGHEAVVELLQPGC